MWKTFSLIIETIVLTAFFSDYLHSYVKKSVACTVKRQVLVNVLMLVRWTEVCFVIFVVSKTG